MSNSNWKTIWNNKQIIKEDNLGDEFHRFCELKKANGFDVAVGNEDAYFRAFYDGWTKFYHDVEELTEPKINTVYEVGCGSGVNLFMFKNRIHSITFGGCDYSESMVKSAKISTGCDDFVCCGADEISITPKYDLAMAESVFQYVESEKYAENVLRKMIQKSNKLTYLGEIHNKDYEEELMEYRRNTIENYEERYRGLNKLFLSKKVDRRYCKRLWKKGDIHGN